MNALLVLLLSIIVLRFVLNCIGLAAPWMIVVFIIDPIYAQDRNRARND